MRGSLRVRWFEGKIKGGSEVLGIIPHSMEKGIRL